MAGHHERARWGGWSESSRALWGRPPNLLAVPISLRLPFCPTGFPLSDRPLCKKVRYRIASNAPGGTFLAAHVLPTIAGDVRRSGDRVRSTTCVRPYPGDGPGGHRAAPVSLPPIRCAQGALTRVSPPERGHLDQTFHRVACSRVQPVSVDPGHRLGAGLRRAGRGERGAGPVLFRPACRERADRGSVALPALSGSGHRRQSNARGVQLRFRVPVSAERHRAGPSMSGAGRRPMSISSTPAIQSGTREMFAAASMPCWAWNIETDSSRNSGWACSTAPASRCASASPSGADKRLGREARRDRRGPAHRGEIGSF